MKITTALILAALAAAQVLCGLFGYLMEKDMLRALDALTGLLGGEEDGKTRVE